MNFIVVSVFALTLQLTGVAIALAWLLITHAQSPWGEVVRWGIAAAILMYSVWVGEFLEKEGDDSDPV